MPAPRRAAGLAAALTSLALLASLVTGSGGSTELLAEPDVPPIVVDTPLPEVSEREAVDHPSLIVRSSDYRALRARADQAPWSGMKDQAAAKCRLTYSAKADTYPRGIRIRDIMGGCSLMYILDPARKATYRARMAKVFKAWPSMLSTMKRQYPGSSNRWLQVVPPSSGYFNSVLALDVLHDDLPSSTLTSYERSMDAVAEWYWAADRGWGTATYGARAIWATYQGDVSRRTLAATQYRRQYLTWLTADGGYRDGSEYALARNGGERSAKQGFLYVAEFTGVDPHYFDDPQVVGSMEWLMSFAYGPSNEMVGFGDASALGRDLHYFQPETALYAAGRFSAAAGAAAARHLAVGGATPPGDLLSYSVTTDPPVKLADPKSRVWPASGAALWERNRSSEALMGALWNPRLSRSQVTAHMHAEVNALSLSGYGEQLLVNAGYAGYGKGALGASWRTLRSAPSSNTVTLAGANHLTPAGDGIDDQLIGAGLDYASGAGRQIFTGQATHVRTFVLVHPQDKKPGYFLSVDEVSGAEAGAAVDLRFHPPATRVRTTTSGQEYRWDIARNKVRPTSLSIFLGTAPTRASTPLSVIGSKPTSIRGRALDARYTTDANGQRRTVTVLFPHDADHAKADMTRMSGPGWSGARITQGKVSDYAVAASTVGRVDVGGARFVGDTAVFRRSGDTTAFYFVRDAVAFDGGDGRGFSADRPVSLHVRGRTGTMTAREPTTIRFSYPRLTTVTVDGRPVTTTTVAGGLQVRVPAGGHAIAFRS